MPAKKTRRLLITGVTRGLGRAMAEEFIELGHTVIGCGTKSGRISELKKVHPAPHDFQLVDVTDDRAVARWRDHVLEQHGPPDVLINNAAIINRNAPLWELSDAEIAAILNVNIRGVVTLIRHFLPGMIRRGEGLIVNISSGWGRSTDAEVASYCATKWAIEGLTQALAQELPDGLAAVALNPGVINTEMLQSCFGPSAAQCPSPADWAERAVPFILGLKPRDNGRPLSVP
jgi:NAD(P)-dependent dehydrogenase (short-subunit alcohol dehydrogenase family)